MDDGLAAKLEASIARQEIHDCLTRYCRGMDRQDHELVRSAFHPDAIDVHHSLVSTIDDFVQWTAAYHAGQERHQHYIMNHSVEIDGDTAHSELYYLFVGTYPSPEVKMTFAGGRYVDRMERRGGEWRIAARYCTAEWYGEGEMPAPVVAAIDSANLRETAVASRDRDDLSYARPLTATPI